MSLHKLKSLYLQKNNTYTTKGISLLRTTYRMNIYVKDGATVRYKK